MKDYFSIYTLKSCAKITTSNTSRDASLYMFTDNDLRDLAQHELHAKLTSMCNNMKTVEDASNSQLILQNDYFNDFFLELKYQADVQHILKKADRYLFTKLPKLEQYPEAGSSRPYSVVDYMFILNTELQTLYKKENGQFRVFRVYLTSFFDGEEEFQGTDGQDVCIFGLNESDQFENPLDNSQILNLMSPSSPQKLMLRSPRGSNNRPELLFTKYELFLNFYKHISNRVRFTSRNTNYLVVIGTNSLFNQFYFEDTQELLQPEDVPIQQEYCDFYDELNQFSQMSKNNLMNLVQALSECFSSLTNAQFERCSYYRDFQRQLGEVDKMRAVKSAFNGARPRGTQSVMSQYIEEMLDYKVVRYLNMAFVFHLGLTLDETLILCEELTEGRVVFRRAQTVSFTPLANKTHTSGLRAAEEPTESGLSASAQINLSPKAFSGSLLCSAAKDGAAGPTTVIEQPALDESVPAAEHAAPTSERVPSPKQEADGAEIRPTADVLQQCEDVLALFSKYKRAKGLDDEERRKLGEYFSGEFVRLGYQLIGPCLCERRRPVRLLDLARVLVNAAREPEAARRMRGLPPCFAKLMQLPLTLEQEGRYLGLCAEAYAAGGALLGQVAPGASLCALHASPEEYIRRLGTLSAQQRRTMAQLIERRVAQRFGGGSFARALDALAAGPEAADPDVGAYCAGRYHNYFELARFYQALARLHPLVGAEAPVEPAGAGECDALIRTLKNTEVAPPEPRYETTTPQFIPAALGRCAPEPAVAPPHGTAQERLAAIQSRVAAGRYLAADLRAMMAPCMCEPPGDDERQLRLMLLRIRRIVDGCADGCARLPAPLDLSSAQTALESALSIYEQLGTPILPIISRDAMICSVDPERQFGRFQSLTEAQKRCVEGQMMAEICVHLGADSFDDAVQKVIADTRWHTDITLNYSRARYHNYFELYRFYQDIKRLALSQ